MKELVTILAAVAVGSVSFEISPAVVESAARDLAPHMIAFYLKELAGEFHSYYNATRVLVPEEPLKLARLALIAAAQQVLGNALALLGVSAPEKM